MGKTITIFGVPLQNLAKDWVLSEYERYLKSKEQHFIVTPNPEMLLLARKNIHFKSALKKASLRLIDGFGLIVCVRLLYGVRLARYTGVDAVGDIVAFAAQNRKKIIMLGGRQGVLEKCIEKLRRQYPSLKIRGEIGPVITLSAANAKGFTADEMQNKKIISLIRQSSPDILLVGFGHGKQELWMSDILPQCPSVRLAIGVGGTFDYLSGDAPRAPLLMRRAGLEWLYRLVREPQRFKRIIDAVIIFPFYATFERLL